MGFAGAFSAAIDFAGASAAGASFSSFAGSGTLQAGTLNQSRALRLSLIFCLLVSLASVALALDLVDGQVARRTGTTSALGAQMDGEVDSFLILVLSVYVARSSGAWVERSSVIVVAVVIGFPPDFHRS